MRILYGMFWLFSHLATPPKFASTNPFNFVFLVPFWSLVNIVCATHILLDMWPFIGAWLVYQETHPQRELTLPLPVATSCPQLLFSAWDFMSAFCLHAGILSDLAFTGFVQALPNAWSSCTTAPVCPEDIFLEVIYHLLLFCSFCFLFHIDPRVLRREGVTQTFHLGLNIPQSLILCTLTSCGSLYKLPSSANRCGSDVG